MEEECAACPEGIPKGECKQSKRPCGHHCNCSFEHDHCHWCDKWFGEDGKEFDSFDEACVSLN